MALNRIQRLPSPMPRKRSKAKQPCPQVQTHLGWRTGSSGGACGQDHLLLCGTWQSQAERQTTPNEGPVLQFLDESPCSSRPEKEANPPSDIGFTEVLDSTLESAPMLWDANWQPQDAASVELNSPIIFEDNHGLPQEDNTIFS